MNERKGSDAQFHVCPTASLISKQQDSGNDEILRTKSDILNANIEIEEHFYKFVVLTVSGQWRWKWWSGFCSNIVLYRWFQGVLDSSTWQTPAHLITAGGALIKGRGWWRGYGGQNIKQKVCFCVKFDNVSLGFLGARGLGWVQSARQSFKKQLFKSSS